MHIFQKLRDARFSNPRPLLKRCGGKHLTVIFVSEVVVKNRPEIFVIVKSDNQTLLMF